MRRLIFYSWQSDLPNATNRSFIQQALENVGKAISADNTIDVDPVIDRDTQGVAGAPDIAKTIFKKVEAADAFVADVSLIGGRRKGRPTPNPNVLVELGYALHALGEELVVLVFNTAYGRLEQLPFDLKMRRAIPYNMPESPADRAPERKALEAKLSYAIRSALKHPRTTVPDSIPDLDSRLAKHKAWAIPKLENTAALGHIGIYCFPYQSISISVRELEELAAKCQNGFSAALGHCNQPEPFQLGISLGRYPRTISADIKSTQRFTLYRDGLIAFDALADLGIGMAGPEVANALNPYWLSYEIQRHLQLVKAALGTHGVGRLRTIVELDGIEGFSLRVGVRTLPFATTEYPYSGIHVPISRDVDMPDIHAHDGPKRNIIMQPVRDIMEEVFGMFGLSPAQGNVSDEDGTLIYVKGLEYCR